MTTDSATTTDPYAWLEDGTDPATLSWQERENARARAALAGIPGRDALRERIDAVSRTGSIGAPVLRGDRTFLTMRLGEQSQARLLLAADDGEADRVLIDPAALDPSGLTSLDWWYPSPSGRYVAYGLSRNGDEKSTLFVLDVTGASAPREAIPHTRWSSLAWLPDESGFYYTASPAGGDFDERLLLHALGTDHAGDAVVFGEGRAPEDRITCELSADGRWLVVSIHAGWTENTVYLADRHADPGAFATLFAVPGARADVGTSAEGLVVLTTDGAPNGRVFLADPVRPARAEWREIVGESADAIHFAAPTAAGILIGWLHDVNARLALRAPDGTLREIPLGFASIAGLSTDERSPTAFVTVSSFFTPPAAHRLDLSGAVVRDTVWRALESPIDPERYTASQRWCVSKDGTRVPLFVLAHRDTPADGTAPAIVYGYGGFSVALTPDFLPGATPWLDAGGVYAIATLRGGSEFGEAWHRAGMRERKQNVFDDYAAAIEFVGSSGIADPHRIGIYGGSNGGLLVGALATQRPELARAAVCAVPVIDMLRYHRFSIGRLWIPEYGDPDVPEDAAFLRAYSPYENVRAATRYPAMLLLSAMADSRVDPMHARKFAAKLLAAAGPEAAPVYCLIEADAGHGQGKPRHKVLEETADRYAFFAWQLGVRSEVFA